MVSHQGRLAEEGQKKGHDSHLNYHHTIYLTASRSSSCVGIDSREYGK